MNSKKLARLTIVITASLIFSTGCQTTRQENGVSIEKKHSLNPLDYIPYLGK